VTDTRTPSSIHVPKVRWGGRWLHELARIPKDGEWHYLATYGRTVAYQNARSLNLARYLYPEAAGWEFGEERKATAPTESSIWVRWRLPIAAARP